jgi:hypothetical protein
LSRCWFAHNRPRPSRRQPAKRFANRASENDVAGADERQGQVGDEPAAHRPGEIDEDQHGQRSESSEDGRLRVPITLSANAKTEGMTMAARALQGGQARIRKRKLRDRRADALRDPP